MKTVDYCICCGNKIDLKIYDSTINSFVVARMLGLTHDDDTITVQKTLEDSEVMTRSGVVWPCKTIVCPVCEMVFCNFRFTKEEESRYYQDYMDDNYITHRIEFDGRAWCANQNYYTTDEYKTLRQNKIASGISAVTDINAIHSVIDYGGNTGELIPNELSHAQRYVLEIQERTLSVGTKQLVDHQLVDLVICAHTLEHVSDPNELIKDIVRYIKPNGYLYIEVPNELNGNGQIGWFHEHINLFTPKSIRHLLESNGFALCGDVNAFTYNNRLIGSAYSVVGQLK